MLNNKVLFIAQEIAPYLPSSAIAELCRSLPQSIQEKGFEVRTFMPKYGMINERRNQLHEVIRLSGLNISIDDSDHPLIIKVATLLPSRMQVYFIDNEDFFHRGSVKQLETITSPDDNDERTIFFVRGVVETVKKLRWEPALVNIVGWIGALAPLYLRQLYADDPSFRSSKIVVSLIDDKFDGQFDSRILDKLSKENLSINPDDAPADYLSLMKLAIDNADGIMIATDNVDTSLIDYANASGKPTISIVGSDNAAQQCIDFYNSL